MDVRLKPKPKGAGKLTAVRLSESTYTYLENEARLHDSTVAEVIRSIIKLWYEEQVPGVMAERGE